MSLSFQFSCIYSIYFHYVGVKARYQIIPYPWSGSLWKGDHVFYDVVSGHWRQRADWRFDDPP